MSKVSIIVYHYVRDLEGSRYPGIKGRRLTEFKRQLDFIGRELNVVTAQQVIAASNGGPPLPENAAWLTFDDGYVDHFENVFPLLLERGWQGSFFPPAATTLDREMLDVNKIHFILASAEPSALVEKLRGFLGEQPGLEPFEYYWQLLASEPDQFDVPHVVFIKRLLQRELPEHMRAQFTDRLFSEYVGESPSDFADQLYMSPAQLQTLIDAGMHVGSHGARHYWMNRLSAAEQAREVDASLAFLRHIGAPTDNWVMCYPYGANNASLHTVLSNRGCSIALTTVPGVADLASDNVMMLPRVDTNKIPF